MRRLALSVSLSVLGFSRQAAASEPPPEKTGVGLLAWGSAGVIVGTGAVVGGIVMGTALGDADGVLGLIPIAIGATWVVLGGVGLHVGRRRHAEYRRWQADSGMTASQWRRRHQPDRPSFSGRGLLGVGALSLTTGACLAGVGFSEVEPREAYEPGAIREYRWLAIHGTIGLVAGATMIVVGSIVRHRDRRWTTVSMTPWLTPTTIGVGATGQF